MSVAELVQVGGRYRQFVGIESHIPVLVAM